MSNGESSDRTYKDFPEALRKLMEARGFSFPKLAREIEQKLSVTYIHNLASGKSRPTKQNIETIARGLKVEPSYFKEYREYEAKEKIDSDPEIADFILDKGAEKLTAALASLTEEQKKEALDFVVREIRSKYRKK